MKERYPLDKFANILRAFFAQKWFFCQKVTREKLRKALLYKKTRAKNVDEIYTLRQFCQQMRVKHSQFYQHLTSIFYADILLTKNYKLEKSFA